jgi:Coenzyme PQQ synthesis protein D (PqqD)
MVVELKRITVVANRDHVLGDLEGDAVILHLTSGVCYGLNAVGTRVWNLIQTPVSALEIRDVLLTEYEVEAEVCEKELVTLLDELCARGLIQITRNTSS